MKGQHFSIFLCSFINSCLWQQWKCNKECIESNLILVSFFMENEENVSISDIMRCVPELCPVPWIRLYLRYILAIISLMVACIVLNLTWHIANKKPCQWPTKVHDYSASVYFCSKRPSWNKVVFAIDDMQYFRLCLN